MLGYWRDRSNKFGDLAKMACDALSIPIMTLASKFAFSIEYRVLSKYRSSMLDETVQALIWTRNWLLGFVSNFNFFLLRIYNKAFPLYNYLLTNANFN